MGLLEGLSQSEIARRTGRDRSTVALVLAAPDTDRIRVAAAPLG
jgi:transcriptional regulator with XRE-family HTH domain